MIVEIKEQQDWTVMTVQMSYRDEWMSDWMKGYRGGNN